VEEIAKACRCHVSSVRKWSQGRRLPNLQYVIDVAFLVAERSGMSVEDVIVDAVLEKRDKKE